MLSNLIKFELKIADKAYHFLCDPNSPIEHVKEALFQFQKAAGQIEDNAKAQQAEVAKQQQTPPIQEEVKKE
jgi:hypothetical protein